MIGIDVKGVKEIESLFKRLETKESAKATRKATRAAQKKEMLPEAKKNVKSMLASGPMTNKIHKSLVVRAMTKLKSGHYGAKVIIKPDDAFVYNTQSGDRYFIPTAIEYGHGFPGQSGQKDVTPRPFMRNAYDTKRKATARKLAKEIMDNLNEAIRRNRK
jgi:hypothetical protein